MRHAISVIAFDKPLSIGVYLVYSHHVSGRFYAPLTYTKKKCKLFIKVWYVAVIKGDNPQNILITGLPFSHTMLESHQREIVQRTTNDAPF